MKFSVAIPRNGDDTGLLRMLVLPMASPCPHMIPSITFHEPDCVPNFQFTSSIRPVFRQHHRQSDDGSMPLVIKSFPYYRKLFLSERAENLPNHLHLLIRLSFEPHSRLRLPRSPLRMHVVLQSGIDTFVPYLLILLINDN